MAASNDSFEYHLTPNGWIDGTSHCDQGTEERPIPKDRVATFVEAEELTSDDAELDVVWRETWRAPGADLDRLFAKFGSYPEGIRSLLRKKLGA